MKKYDSFVFKIMNVIFWLVFIGASINAGGVLFAILDSFTSKPFDPKLLYTKLDLTQVMSSNIWHYRQIITLLFLVKFTQAVICYFVVKITLELKFENPFSDNIVNLLYKIRILAAFGALFSLIARSYSEYFAKSNFTIPIVWTVNEFLFFAGVIFILEKVFRKGFDLQSENDLTV